MGEEVGRLGGFFCYEHPGMLQSVLQKPRRGELARVFQHFQNVQQQLMEV